MMSYIKTALTLVIAGGLCACTATSQQNVETPAVSANVAETSVSMKAAAPVATVKPGASVTLNSVLPPVMASGSYQSVQLRLSEGYTAGTLSVSIEPSAGLNLFGGVSSKTFDMTQLGEHVWDIDVKSDVDGVYFLNVFADAQGESRAFSVRLNMGQTTQKMFDAAMPSDGEMSDGGKIRVLKADETIK